MLFYFFVSNSSLPLITDFKDFCNYLIKILEDPERPWNLTRVGQIDKEEKNDYNDFIWTIKTHIPEVSVWPTFMVEFDKEDIIKDKIEEEHKDYLDILTEIGDLMTTNIENIEGKLENLAEAENDAIESIIDKIEEEYPKLFDEMPKWRNILQDRYPGKINKLNSLIKVSGKAVRIGNIREYIKLTKQLKSHKGSIMGDAPEKAITAKEKELRMYTENNSARRNAFERRGKFNRHLQLILRRTDEYKEVKADITELEEELENREVEEDERKEILKEFKKKLEEIFKDLLKELKEFEVEEELENEEIDDEDIEYLEYD